MLCYHLEDVSPLIWEASSDKWWNVFKVTHPVSHILVLIIHSKNLAVIIEFSCDFTSCSIYSLFWPSCQFPLTIPLSPIMQKLPTKGGEG